MLQRKVQNIHTSKFVSIPAQLCTMLGIKKGTIMSIELENNKIIMSPIFANRQVDTNIGDVVQPREAAHHE